MTPTKELIAGLRASCGYENITTDVRGIRSGATIGLVTDAADRLEALTTPVEGMEVQEALDYLRAGTEEYGSYPGDITTVYDETHVGIAALIDRLSSALAAERARADAMQEEGDKAAFGASDAACVYYPEDTPEHIAARKAYCDGAAAMGQALAAERERAERLAGALMEVRGHIDADNCEAAWATIRAALQEKQT